MTLEIGFGTDIYAVLVAKFVEIGVAGVVAGTHRIDVQFFHRADILQHLFAADDIAAVGIHFVAVGTLDEDGLAVEKHLATLNLNMAETYLLANAFYRAIVIGQGYVQGVKVGGFCCPEANVGDVGCECSLGTRQFLCLLPHYAALVVIQGGLYLLALGIRGIKVYGKLAGSETFVQVLADVQVLDMSLGTGIQIHLACNTRKAPEVLVLAIRTVAPAHNLHADEVLLARLQELGYVKFGSILRVLAVAHLLAVYPQGEVAGGRTHIHDDILALPFCWHHNLLAVRTGVVVLLLNVWRFWCELCGPSVTYILIYNIAIAVQFEQAGHRKLHPVVVVECGRVETLRCIIVVACEVEVPHSFQRKVAVALCLLAFLGKSF